MLFDSIDSDILMKLGIGLCVGSVSIALMFGYPSSKDTTNNVKPQYVLYDQNGIKQLNCLEPNSEYKIIKLQNTSESDISVSMFNAEFREYKRISFDILKPNEIKEFKNPNLQYVSYESIVFELYDYNNGKLIGFINPNCKIK